MSTLIAKDFIKKENIFSIPLRIPLRITLRIPLGIYPEKNSFETFFLEPSPWNLGSQSFSKLLLNIAVILWTVLWNIFSFLIRLIQLVETPSMCLTFTIDIRTIQIRKWLWFFPGVSLPPSVESEYSIIFQQPRSLIQSDLRPQGIVVRGEGEGRWLSMSWNKQLNCARQMAQFFGLSKGFSYFQGEGFGGDGCPYKWGFPCQQWFWEQPSSCYRIFIFSYIYRWVLQCISQGESSKRLYLGAFESQSFLKSQAISGPKCYFEFSNFLQNYIYTLLVFIGI